MISGVEADASANQPKMNLGHFLFVPWQTTNRTIPPQSNTADGISERDINLSHTHVPQSGQITCRRKSFHCLWLLTGGQFESQ